MNFTKNNYRNNTLLAMAVTLVLSVSLTGCNDKADVQQLPQRKYQLVWSDEFDSVAGASPNVKKWSFQLGNNNGWGNAEYEIYTNKTANVSTDGSGNLAITATKVAPTASNPYATYYSGRIITKGLFTQTYGRYEARIKLPYGPGIWPAFWMLGANDSIGWPNCGEIDIMELNGSKPTIINGSVHGPGYSGGSAITKSFGLTNARFDTNFHVFAIEWGKDYIDYFVDNVLYEEITPTNVTGKGNWVFNDHPFYILLNLAVGGNYVTGPSDQTPFPQTMLVDYVRVYQEVK